MFPNKYMLGFICLEIIAQKTNPGKECHKSGTKTSDNILADKVFSSTHTHPRTNISAYMFGRETQNCPKQLLGGRLLSLGFSIKM